MKKYLFKNKIVMFLYVLSVPIACFFSVKFALSFEPIIEAVIKGDSSSFKIASIWAIIYTTLDCLFFLIIKFSRESLMKGIFIHLKRDLFSNIINFDVSKFSRDNTGSYISTLNNDVDLLGRGYFESILSLYNVVISFVFSMIAVLYLNYVITLVLILIACLSIFIPKLLNKKLSSVQTEYSEAMKTYTSKIKDFFEGFQVVRSFNIQDKIIDKHFESLVDRETSGYNSRTTIFFAGWISMVFSSTMYVATFVLGGYFTLIGTMSLGLVVSLSQLIGGVVAPLERIPAMLSQIYSTKDIRRKLEDILSFKPDRMRPDTIKSTINEITFNDVSFRYEDSSKDSLKNINLQFQASKKYALVGGSGSGKSTLAKLMAGFYSCTGGAITMDDKNIENISKEDICNTVGFIPQSTFLFHDTLKNNITLYGNYSDDDIDDAILKSGLKPLVDGLENGIHTDVGENGNLFSGGEKQRIGLARAFLKNDSFLLLDEATSNLDNITSNSILPTLINTEGITPIVITHQLNVDFLRSCDVIYVMKDGNLIESGSLDQLDKKEKYFYKLLRGVVNEEVYQK